MEKLLQTPDTTSNILMLNESFHQAKIEHYLKRAEEYLQMARYSKALKTIQTVFALDEDNSAGKSLQKRVEYYLDSIGQSRRRLESNNGTPDSHLRRKRQELVLIIDQDERVLTTLVSGLRKYGFEAIAAAGYDEAVETLVSYRPDLVVSEVNFENGPVGFDLFLWVRTNIATQEIPFLFLATRIDRDMLIAGKRLGVNDFIMKPLDEALVTASVINCLTRKKKAG
ncbi:MAG: response regulator receiver modulated diguanylate cyclase [Bacteroidetes bacterium]|nr:response regulator receiver modulated diguanylate cyclase [Bacteroidota bacterium]